MNGFNSNDKRDAVRDAYAGVARRNTSCCGSSAPDDIAGAIGYTVEELIGLPEGANMGLSCGNPTAFASLIPEETVLDLGCGGGFDVFIAAKKVGEGGKVIGVDMTPEMISKARRNALLFQSKTEFDNVEFRLGEIEHLPVADNSVDIVISNCVINLATDKPQVWREIARVLKPGGRVSVSDMALLKHLPEQVRESVAAYTGCIAGAVLIEETEYMAYAAGLRDFTVTVNQGTAEALADLKDPLYSNIKSELPEAFVIGDYVTSVTYTAVKPL